MNLTQIDETNYRALLPRVGNLIAGFYQLWQLDYADSDAVIDEWLLHLSGEGLRRAERETREILFGGWTDEEIEELVQRLGSYIDFSSEGTTGRGWLEKLLTLIVHRRDEMPIKHL